MYVFAGHLVWLRLLLLLAAVAPSVANLAIFENVVNLANLANPAIVPIGTLTRHSERIHRGALRGL